MRNGKGPLATSRDIVKRVPKPFKQSNKCQMREIETVWGNVKQIEVAEGAGFEPARGLNTPNPLSRRAH